MVILCQHLRFVLRFLALYKYVYVCTYVFLSHQVCSVSQQLCMDDAAA